MCRELVPDSVGIGCLLCQETQAGSVKLGRPCSLLSGHHGFATIDAGYEQTRAGWEYFLGGLKSYLETGKGTLHVS